MRAPGDIPLHLLAGTAYLVLARLYWRYRGARGPVASGAPGLTRAIGHLIDVAIVIAWSLVVAHTVHPTWFSWTEVRVPFFVRAVAVPAVITTVVMLSWVVGEAEACYRAGGSDRLVTTGAYAVIRHPLYVSVVAVLASLTVLSASVVVAALTLCTSVELIGRRAPSEDRELAMRFGADFDVYRVRVPAFLRFARMGNATR